MECQCVCFRLAKWFVITPLSLSFKWSWFGTCGMQGGQNMGSLPNHTPTHLPSFFCTVFAMKLARCLEMCLGGEHVCDLWPSV